MYTITTDIDGVVHAIDPSGAGLVFRPGLDDYSSQPQEILDVCASVQTLECIIAYRNKGTPVDPKKVRDEAVAAIKVTTSSGRVFDGDEVAQNRMNRAITGLVRLGIPTIQWKLFDNTVATVTVDELGEALALSGMEQSRIWML